MSSAIVTMKPEESVIFYSVCTLGSLGLVINSILLGLTTTKELRAKAYIHFIMNRTMVDFVLTLHCVALQPVGIMYWEDAPGWCDVAGAFCSVLSSAMVFSEPLLAFNRYISICRNQSYQKLFRKRNIYMMCVSSWILSLLITIPHFVLGNLGRVEGVMCQVQLLKRTSFIVYLCTDQTTAVVSYGIILFFHCKILSFLRNHQNQPNTHGQASRLQEDRELLRCIMALAIFPLITSIPVGICSILFMEDPGAIPDYVLTGSNVLFLLCPIMNSITTIFIIRPIRRQLVGQVKKLLRCDGAKEAVTRVNVIAMDGAR